VRVDKFDNIWAADKGSDMVVKFNPAGQVSMVFGRKQEASDEGTEPLKHPKPPLPPVDGMFPQVTDVTWNAAGDALHQRRLHQFRVAKVDIHGRWLKSFGEPGDGPANSTRRTVLPPMRREMSIGEPRRFPHRSLRRRGQVPPPD